MRRHPIVAELGIPEPDQATVEEIAADMRENGWDRRYPSIIFQKCVLVGSTREAAAKLAGIKPLRKQFKGNRDQAVDFVWRSEISRRHLTAEQRKKMVDGRRVRVAELREKGESIRTIAEQVKVPKSTIADDVAVIDAAADATVRGRTVDGKTVGKDGKKRPQSVSPVRCSRCERLFKFNKLQSLKGCEACKRLKMEAAAVKSGHTEPGTHNPRATGVKGGRPCYDDRPFRDGFGILMRQIDTFGNLYMVKESGAAERLREELSAFKKHFDEWRREVSRAPVRPD